MIRRYHLALVLLLAAPLRATTPTALLNGSDLTGWELVTQPTTPAALADVCHYSSYGVLAVSGQPSCYLATTASYENYILHVEWRWPEKPGNSGILLHIASGPKDKAWPLCQQVQLKNKAVGDVLPMAGATFAEPLAPDSKTPTRVRFATDNEKPVGQWNFCDIICRNDMIEIHLNGVLTNRVTQVTPHSGRIGFQLEGVPFELRHIRIEPAKAAIIGTYQFPPLPLPARK
jgi:hypothetical protein